MIYKLDLFHSRKRTFKWSLHSLIDVLGRYQKATDPVCPLGIHDAVPLASDAQERFFLEGAEHLGRDSVLLATVEWLRKELDVRVVAGLLALNNHRATQFYPRNCQYRPEIN